MKIELPKGSNIKKAKGNPKRVKVSKGKFKPKQKKKGIKWTERGDFILAKIGKKVIKINVYSFNIEMDNNFIIKCKSIEDAKNKIKLLFG